MRQTLISFDLKGHFGVFKKPDVNEGMQLTFNMLHKPALLGILGAIVGLDGYKERGVFPEYYEKLRHLRVGIEPLGHDKGSFVKTVIKYTNTVGYANADGNLIVTEQTLCQPAYRCYLLLDLDDPLHTLLYDRIKAGEAEYLPYFGKNECAVWWEPDDVQVYDFENFIIDEDFKVTSIFVRDISVKAQQVRAPRISFALRAATNMGSFSYFERLPEDFFVGDEPAATTSGTVQKENKKTALLKFVQYQLTEFAYTDWTLKSDSDLPGLFKIKSAKINPQIIQLF